MGMLENGMNPQVDKNRDVLGQPAVFVLFYSVSAVTMISDLKLKKI